MKPVNEEFLQKIQVGTAFSVYTNKDLFDIAKRGVVVKVPTTFTLLENCRKKESALGNYYEIGAVDWEGKFCLLGGWELDHPMVIKKAKESHYMQTKYKFLIRLTLEERFKPKDLVEVEIVASFKQDAIVGRETEGVVCLFDRQTEIEEGSVWKCTIMKVREKYLFVKKHTLVRTALQNKELLENRIKNLAETYKGLAKKAKL